MSLLQTKPPPLNLSLRKPGSVLAEIQLGQFIEILTILSSSISNQILHPSTTLGWTWSPISFQWEFPITPLCSLSNSYLPALSILILLGHKSPFPLYLKLNTVLHGGFFCPIMTGKHSWMCNWWASHILTDSAWTGWEFLGTEVKQKPADWDRVFMNSHLYLAQLSNF